VIEAAKPALVGIVTTRPAQDGRGAAGRVSGVGFIVEPSGYILTSRRAVRGPSVIHVRLADGRTLPVTLIAFDPPRDVAALKVKATGLPTIRLGRSSALKVGEVVVLLGTPVGSEQAGAISATDSAARETLAVTVAVGPNSTGGPLINARGEAVGIATGTGNPTREAPATSVAVPIDRAKPILRRLQARTHRPERHLAAASRVPVGPVGSFARHEGK
jgi:serine protease Do